MNYKTVLLSLVLAATSAKADVCGSIYRDDLPGLFDAVERGNDLNSEYCPAIMEVARRNGAHSMSINGVQDDLESGPLLSVDKKVVLINYLKKKGANPNAKVRDYGDSEGGRAAIHAVRDPRLMAALLNIGADPLLRQGKENNGPQALLSFLYGYKYYDNKAYFRVVVKKLLDAGADTNDCHSDHSACVMDVAKSQGDSDLVNLIETYRTKKTDSSVEK